MLKNLFAKLNYILVYIFSFAFCHLAMAQDTTGISEVDSMLTHGQQGIEAFGKWGGILSVVGAGVALASGKLEGHVARTIAVTLIGIALIAAAFGYFKSNEFGFGFSF